jgi:enamine deaminase RidA (YjgF/YER057c/UK114 family)
MSAPVPPAARIDAGPDGRLLYTTGWRSEQVAAYSRAIRAGGLVFVSGTTGYNYAADRLPDTAREQTEGALANIDAALRKLGSRLEEVVMLTTYYTRDEDWPQIMEVLGARLASIRPTNSAIRCALVAETMLVEIAAVAVAADPPP